MARAIIKMASSQIRMRRAGVSPSSPLTLRGEPLTMASAMAPMKPEANLEESTPSVLRSRREQPQHILEASASKGMGNKQMAATAKVCRKLPVQCASRMESAATGRIADCTKTRIVPDTKTPIRKALASLLAARSPSSPGRRKGNRTRSGRKGGRIGNARATQARYNRLMQARTAEVMRSGDLTPEPVTGWRATGNRAPRPRPRSLAKKIRDCCLAC
mmetsp:Transcript_110143/g.322268  ORF Transcript_110143/g.322268 Transcript_110143/m.322268 type:complete len:217 (-) Transcript_110143:1603-2253(-)